MDNAHTKGLDTRRRNEAARAALCAEQAAAINAARRALQRVLENQGATPAEVLEAARMLVALGS